MSRKPRYSLALEVEPANPNEAYRHYMKKLSYETDIADLSIDIKKGYEGIIVVDVRDAEAYKECHIPTAISIPGNKINEDTTKRLSKEKVIITYCWGPACNGATKAAAKFAQLGFRVKELIGGIEYWRKENGEVEGTLGAKADLFWNMKKESKNKKSLDGSTQ
ncbi:rhodanese-like domain-containing protein [Halalkalibacterium halodurans]|uniref:BH2092 protein n=2 Tax=Halalkalibacterium halodurans TaxID=86665 RepID=Q9KB42_HALH5|nr:rhodanese-like domain-containing protein [Halalkalibacterium halodurans]BAB05811.1 BH2092 [Halalkalibacterium halodurans C-125]MDY7222643.1 rhodanese-like domain-containing protein [Halalkalibacterium halodurans]MDY7241864.1 rhodanese-like domain-containing protein [Halalkalibacterium halodurans]MED4082466.1 rhodanese-like domain-containing protein [Halalkalibacterium halodurans]MED4085029.1 rhodanese-like domain-containing protein [Halalkalibacterium halodurans]